MWLCPKIMELSILDSILTSSHLLLILSSSLEKHQRRYLVEIVIFSYSSLINSALQCIRGYPYVVGNEICTII